MARRKHLSVSEIIEALPNLTPEERNRVCEVLLNDPSSLGRKVVDVLANLIDRQRTLHDLKEDRHLAKRKQAIDVLTEALAEHKSLAKKWEGRNRQSDPDTIRRNLEIIALRESNPKHWSLTRLSRKYDQLSKPYISQVLKEESAWREKARRQGLTDQSVNPKS